MSEPMSAEALHEMRVRAECDQWKPAELPDAVSILGQDVLDLLVEVERQAAALARVTSADMAQRIWEAQETCVAAGVESAAGVLALVRNVANPERQHGWADE